MTNILKKRPVSIFSTWIMITLALLIYQNATNIDELINTINSNNPGRITVKLGTPSPGTVAETTHLPNGGQLIVIKPTLPEATAVDTLIHELIHAASNLNDDPMNFHVIGYPSGDDFYADSFGASEVSAYFGNVANFKAHIDSLAIKAPDTLVAMSPKINDTFYALFKATNQAVSHASSLLSQSSTVNQLALSGDATTNLQTSSGSIAVVLQLRSQTLVFEGGLVVTELACLGCTGPGKWSKLLFKGFQMGSTEAARRAAIQYMIKKLSDAKKYLAQVNPNTTNGVALKQRNANAYKLALARAKANVLGRGTSPAPPESTIGHRPVTRTYQTTLTGIRVQDVSGLYIRTVTVTASDARHPDGTIAFPGYTYTQEIPDSSMPSDGFLQIPDVMGCYPFCPLKQ